MTKQDKIRLIQLIREKLYLTIANNKSICPFSETEYYSKMGISMDWLNVYIEWIKNNIWGGRPEYNVKVMLFLAYARNGCHKPMMIMLKELLSPLDRLEKMAKGE